MAAGDRLLGDRSRPEHAYALGVIAAAGRVDQGVLSIELRGDGQPLLGLLAARTASDVPALYSVETGRVRIGPPHGKLASDWLAGAPGTREPRFPELAPALSVAFVRGMFDASARISSPRSGELTVTWQKPAPALLHGALEFLGLPPDKDKKSVVIWRGAAALDLLGQLYGEFAPLPRERTPAPRATPPGSGADPARPGPYRAPAASDLRLYRKKHLARFWAWSNRVLGFRQDGSAPGEIHVQLVHAAAVLPRKERVSDSGYDLTLLYEKSRHGNVTLYGTGIIVEPPTGWYFDVVARSSIIKRGYMLANNVGIIDRAYRGEILVPLLKTDPAAKDLQLPARIAQLIPRPIVHFPLSKSEQLSVTQRGAGGFGSTG